MKIEEVILTFENMESVSILGKNIDFLSFKEPVNIHWGINLGTGLVMDKLFPTCEYFTIALLPEANDSSFAKFYSETDCTPFERLQKLKDIGSVEIYYNNGEMVEFYIEWKGTKGSINCSENQYQSSKMLGDILNISIEK